MRTKLITLDIAMEAPPSNLRLAVSDSKQTDSGVLDSDVFDSVRLNSNALNSNALNSNALRSHIETQLKTYGTPLRWSITHIDSASKTAHVEAVVTTI